MTDKSLHITYILWFLFGYAGAHHFYLGRDRQGLFNLLTGGMFGIGWLRDLFYIQSHVDEVNESPKYLENLAEKMRTQAQPEWNFYNSISALVLALIINGLCHGLFIWDDDTYEESFIFITCVSTICVAIGVYIPSTEGSQTVDFSACLIPALVMLPFSLWCGPTDTSLLLDLLASPLIVTMFATYTRQWRQEPEDSDNICIRISVISVLGFLYICLIVTNVTGAVIYMINTPQTEADLSSVKSIARQSFMEKVNEFAAERNGPMYLVIHNTKESYRIMEMNREIWNNHIKEAEGIRQFTPTKERHEVLEKSRREMENKKIIKEKQLHENHRISKNESVQYIREPRVNNTKTKR